MIDAAKTHSRNSGREFDILRQTVCQYPNNEIDLVSPVTMIIPVRCFSCGKVGPATMLLAELEPFAVLTCHHRSLPTCTRNMSS